MTYFNPICADVGTRTAAPARWQKPGIAWYAADYQAHGNAAAGGQASAFIMNICKTGAWCEQKGRLGAPGFCKGSGKAMIYLCCSFVFREVLLWKHPGRVLFYF